MLAELLGGQQVDYASVETSIAMVGRHQRAPALLPGGGRLIKTHERYHPRYHRAIYLVRDVRDVAPSVRRMREVEGADTRSLDSFLHDFAAGRGHGFGTWQANVASWLDAADRGADILVVRYEDLIDDTARELRRMLAYLRVDIAGERLASVIAGNRSDEMAKRDGGLGQEIIAMAQAKATYGGWRDLYTEPQLAMLAPTAPVMRRLGYDVTDTMQDPVG